MATAVAVHQTLHSLALIMTDSGEHIGPQDYFFLQYCVWPLGENGNTADLAKF